MKMLLPELDTHTVLGVDQKRPSNLKQMVPGRGRKWRLFISPGFSVLRIRKNFTEMGNKLVIPNRNIEFFLPHLQSSGGREAGAGGENTWVWIL